MVEEVERAADAYVSLLSRVGEKWSLHAMGDLSDDYEKATPLSSLRRPR